jgi:hypothetical protein
MISPSAKPANQAGEPGSTNVMHTEEPTASESDVSLILSTHSMPDESIFDSSVSDNSESDV